MHALSCIPHVHIRCFSHGHHEPVFSYAPYFHFLLSSSSSSIIVRSSAKKLQFDRIYQLGDSISDTGNLIRESALGAASAFSRLPYGETFFRNPTGRCSNGLLMIDYFAGLPFLNPYMDVEANFKHGANFAVAGSTALSTSILADKKIISPVTNSSLGIQLHRMSTHFKSLCHHDKDCVKILKNSLFMVGEIGGNDYNYAFLQGKSIEEVKEIVPQIVQTIMDAVTRVIHYGAIRVVVPGNFPIGCLPIYLTAFQTNDSAVYDEDNCLKGLNNLSKYHNDHLEKEIKDLKQENPNALIVYADYYNTFKSLFHIAPYLGFDATSLHKACCGIGGKYNFNLTRMCGAPDVPVCPDPHRRFSWDGVHLTQEAYKFMAEKLIHELLPKLQCF